MNKANSNIKELNRNLVLFGKSLREFRKEAGLSQDELSFQSGVDRSYISEIENGLKAPSILTILALTGSLKIKPSDLMDRFENKS
ncbi:MAG: helix-turn-helix transcriptional regulator [Paenibacillaceae bacterium]